MIPYSKQIITWGDVLRVAYTLKFKNLTQGSSIKRFEDCVANYVGSEYAVAVSSATAGLHLSHLALNTPAGSKIATSPMSFVASANSAIYAGLRPVFIDIDPNSGNISVESFRKEIARHEIKTLVPVHYAGAPCDMKSLYELCNSKDINIIEDAAHALGSLYPSGEKIGSCKFSDLTVFSFHPVKNITTGEGGIITTNNKELYETLLKLRSHGIGKDLSNFKNKKLSFTAGVVNPWYYEMSILGFHYRITDLQATLGYSQMKKLKKFLRKRNQLAQRYDQAFANNQFFQPTQLDLRNYSAKHLYPIKIDFSKISLSKNEIIKKLKESGIITQVHYLPIPLHAYYQELGYDIRNLPNTTKFYNEVLSIPLFPNLGRIRQRKIIKQLRGLIRR
jgi:UDP-4-amino-4,6-dideoxy-N-acetyl-beta-L-altrosamine transaminase